MRTTEEIATELLANGTRLADFIRELRAAVVQQALIKYGSSARAAKAIGIDRKTFRAVRARQSR